MYEYLHKKQNKSKVEREKKNYYDDDDEQKNNYVFFSALKYL